MTPCRVSMRTPIFQAFSFLKNSIKEAQQMFVLTHNFDFFRLLVNWIKYSKQKAGYYMIKNAYGASGDRSASICRRRVFRRRRGSRRPPAFRIRSRTRKANSRNEEEGTPCNRQQNLALRKVRSRAISRPSRRGQ